MRKRRRKRRQRVVPVTFFPRFDARTGEYTCALFDASEFDLPAASPLTITMEISEDQPTWGDRPPG